MACCQPLVLWDVCQGLHCGAAPRASAWIRANSQKIPDDATVSFALGFPGYPFMEMGKTRKLIRSAPAEEEEKGELFGTDHNVQWLL